MCDNYSIFQMITNADQSTLCTIRLCGFSEYLFFDMQRCSDVDGGTFLASRNIRNPVIHWIARNWNSCKNFSIF